LCFVHLEHISQIPNPFVLFAPLDFTVLGGHWRNACLASKGAHLLRVRMLKITAYAKMPIFGAKPLAFVQHAHLGWASMKAKTDVLNATGGITLMVAWQVARNVLQGGTLKRL